MERIFLPYFDTGPRKKPGLFHMTYFDKDDFNLVTERILNALVGISRTLRLYKSSSVSVFIYSQNFMMFSRWSAKTNLTNIFYFSLKDL